MGIASACSSPPHFWSKQNEQNAELNLLDLSESLLIIARQNITTSPNHHKLPQLLQYQIWACCMTGPTNTNTAKICRNHPKQKPSETLKPWFLLTAKVPNWAINCSYLHLSTSSKLGRCTCSIHPTPIPFECASQTAQSAHWHSTTSYHCDILWPMSWVAKTRASNPTRCRDAWRGSYSGMFKKPSHTSTLANIEPWDSMRLNETSRLHETSWDILKYSEKQTRSQEAHKIPFQNVACTVKRTC